MSAFIKTAGRWGGIVTIILLVITLLKQLIAFVGFLMTALKVGIVLAFIGLLVLIALTILRDNRRRKDDAI
ncbi:MAG: hypothetical protein ACRDRT_16040 [Pseudonocardiaceae bacterium]